MRFLWPVAIWVLSNGIAFADAPKVATDIAPVHALVSRVMEGVGTPDLLLGAGQSPHTTSMRPSQAQSLQDAALIVWIGPELTPWLEKPIETLAADAMRLELLDLEETKRLPYRESGLEDADHADHGNSADGSEEHDHAGTDPHAWLDPDNAGPWMNAIAEALAGLDPGNAAVYRANASAGAFEIAELATKIDALLSPVRGRPVATFHDGFQYFEARFGLVSSGSLTLSAGAAPSPAQVDHLREVLASQGVSCVFSEPQYDDRLIRAAAEGLPLRVAVLDPLGAGVAPGAALYPALLETMAASILDCLSD